jgi:hypothetical protein
MSSLLAAAIPVGIWLGGVAVLVGIVNFTRRTWQRSDRRSPLTKGLLRGPAYSLREQLEGARSDFGLFLVLVPTAPLLAYSAYLQSNLEHPSGAGTAVIFGIAAFGLVVWSATEVVKQMQRIRNLRLGLEAELATAEELNRLMRDGFWVFHDVPGEQRFNVDHVVVGPTGVFAVETKGRPKQTGASTPNGHKVDYDGKSLGFPGWREVAPLEQARRNADWLRTWLSSAVGEPVSVRPVLVLPGWYVNRTSGEGIPVLNGKNPQSYFARARGERLSDKLIQQIVHQLDQRCRDIEPKAK